MTVAHINRIGTAVPDHDVHEAYIRFVETILPDRRSQILFRRMAQRAEIRHRYSVLQPAEHPGEAVDAEGFLPRGAFPSTGARMARYTRHAADLAERAVDALELGSKRDEITHLVVASCTGFTAPGVDQQLQDRLRLRPDLERTQVGFMGCSAAVNALKVAHHVVRSEPEAKVLVVNLELCTLHMQDHPDLEKTLTALLFGDGCAATLVTAEPTGVAIKDFRATTIPGTGDLITWDIGDQGFDMHLSGDVPAQIQRALRGEAARNDESGIFRGQTKHDFDLWAVHAGGRTVLDAVEAGLELDPSALDWSRGVLSDFGNMSSATIMFVLERMMREARHAADGFGMAFGPGLVAETFRFRMTG
jgi:predicted naringenin-chalcone synthase